MLGGTVRPISLLWVDFCSLIVVRSTGIKYNLLQTQIMSQGHGFLACYTHLVLLKRKPCLDNEQVKKGKKGGNIGSHIFTI